MRFKRNFFVCSILSFVFLILSFSSLSQSYYFANYSVKDGLAQSNISGIVQDSSGFYWIATAGGVSRFDGKHFINYASENGLAESNVTSIYKDNHNFIWFGHDNGKITRYDGKNFQEIKSDVLPKDKRIFSFYQDKQNNIWIATENSGAIKISNAYESDLSKIKLQGYATKEGLNQLVLTIFEDSENNFWFLTDLGIKTSGKDLKTFEFFKPEGMPFVQVSSMELSKNNSVFFGTINGTVYEYNLKSKLIQPLIQASDIFKLGSGIGFPVIYSINTDSKNNLWISVLNFGALKYNLQSKRMQLFNSSNGLSLNKIKSIFEDNEGNILLSTAGEGFDVYSGEKFVCYTKRNGLVDNQIWAICEIEKGIFWFGTNEGISELNVITKEVVSNKHPLPNNNVRALVKDASNNIWIATWGAKILKYDAAKKKIISVPALNDIVNNYVTSLLIDSKNQLWIGTVEGIVIYNLHTQQIKTLRTIDGLCSNDINCMFESSSHEIWIGSTQKGISVYNGKGFVNYGRKEGLNFSTISSITQDNKKNIWIASEGGGAFVFENGKFKNLKIKDGLLSDYITVIYKDKKNNIWFGTNKGLNKINLETQKITSYSHPDGFTGLETKPRAVFEDSEKNIWFGSVNGAFKYQSLEDVGQNKTPSLELLDFKINLNSVELKPEITLSYKDNNLYFKFIGISISNPNGVSYQYRLEGLDKDWSSLTKNNEVNFSNLSPGKYIFELKTCNGAGVCSEIITVAKIVIEPPFWKTWWFYTLVIMIVAGSLFAYIKIREKKLIQEKKILENKVQERTLEVVEQKKVIEEKAAELAERHKEITDSINYAERIQRSFMATKSLLDENLNEYFVLFQPKDVVSGDFFWASKVENEQFAIVTADSTGHGVPGAIMSILNISSLEKSFETTHQPDEILNNTRKIIIERLKKDGSPEGGKDGMDCSLICLDFKNNLLSYAAANNPIWIIRELNLIELAPDKMPVGKHDKDHVSFTKNTIELQKGDVIYTLTDGLPDQFGGAKGKKFMYKKLKEFLMSISQLPMKEQKNILEQEYLNWKGNLEQVDDVTLIGIRV